MSSFEVPDFVPEFLSEPRVNFWDGYFEKLYADGVSVVYDVDNSGFIYDVETRYPDRSLHYEKDDDGVPLYIVNGIPEDTEI